VQARPRAGPGELKHTAARSDEAERGRPRFDVYGARAEAVEAVGLSERDISS
jgi:hypothetical protein